MQRRTLRSPWVLALLAGAVLSVSAMAADMAGSGVTFANGSDHRVTLYTRYGSDSSCESKPQSSELTVDPGQNASLDSGSSSACFCLEVPERRTCPSGWVEVKPGSTRKFV
ncbi:MAG TPA: hypothetical protein VF173_02325 [Thermoanaerobaculia bacterium]|nr:hypothetical protein [Thermoanaerobaculia bacterium]